MTNFYGPIATAPLCLAWNGGSYFTPDNGDRQLSETCLHLHLRGVMFTEPKSS